VLLSVKARQKDGPVELCSVLPFALMEEGFRVLALLSYVALIPFTPTLKKLQLAAGRCRHQITEVDQTRIMFKIILVMKNNKHHFYSDVCSK
jgi:hypothetical protein